MANDIKTEGRSRFDLLKNFGAEGDVKIPRGQDGHGMGGCTVDLERLVDFIGSY